MNISINTNMLSAQVTINHLIWIPNPEFNLTWLKELRLKTRRILSLTDPVID